jgi:tetratricopeptide (TPR) repeat protein
MTVTDLKNLVVEVLHHDDKGWSAGSGFFVSKGLVLTALHIVDGPGEVLIRIQGKEEHPAEVLLRGDKIKADLAVLKVSDAAVDVPPLRYGEVDRREARIVKECWAVGFPRFKVLKHEPSKPKPPPPSAHVWGDIPTGEFLGQQLLTLQVSNKSPRPLRKGSEWGGMSGAVVFSGDDIVVGVVIEHRLPEGESALTVVPITALDLLLEAEATKWWKLLGVDRQRLVPLPGNKHEQRLQALIAMSSIYEQIRGSEITDIASWDYNSLVDAPEILTTTPKIAELSSNKDVPFQAIEVPANFIGRDEEYEVLEKELQSGRRVVVIRNGLGGIGKTSLAAYLAHRLRHLFPDGVLWGRVDTEDTKVIMLSFIESFGISSAARLKYLSTDTARASYYRSLLADKRCLIVLDNAESPEQVRPLIPSLGASQVVITTRYAISSAIAQAFDLHLDVLSTSSSISLFSALSNVDVQLTSSQALEVLVARLGHLPLAIRIAAGIVRDLHWTVDDYLKRLQESSTLDWVSTEDDPISVRKSFAISYSSLSQEITKKIFRTLGIFQQANIPSAVIAYIVKCSLNEVEHAILTLVRRGLIEIEAEKQSYILIHPLMRRYMIELLVQSGEEQVAHAHAYAGQWYRDHISFWKDSQQQFQYGVLGTEEDAVVGLTSVSHYYQAKLYDQAQEVLVAIADTVSLQGREDSLIKYSNELNQVTKLVPWLQLYRCKFLTTSKDSEVVEEGVNTQLDLAKSSDLKVASAALIHLASMKTNARQYEEAQQLLKESQKLKEQLIPPDAKGISYILNQLAHISLQTGGRYRDALEQHNQALKIQRQIADTKGIAYTLLKMAVIHLRHLNETEQALEMLSEAEALANDAVSKIVLVFIWMEKAEALRHLEYYADAVENLQQALGLAATFDNPFPEAHVLRRLALVYEQIEFYGDALRCIERCRAIVVSMAPEQASKLDKNLRRIQTKTKNLEEELHQIETKLQEPGQVKDNTERRLMSRRRKRLRQKLGLEPALIRLGKHSKYK